MPEIDDIFDIGDDEPGNADWAKARKGFAEEKDARTKAEQATAAALRENAFLKAGINPDDPKMAYFVAGYTGEMDPEKIKETAQKDGFLATPATPADPARAAAAADQQQMDAASAGATPPGTSAEADLEAAFKEGGEDAIEDFMRQTGIPVRHSS